MKKIRERGEDICRFILNHVDQHPSDIAKITAKKFGISRQAVNRHLTRLVDENNLAESGKTRSRTYRLTPLVEWHHSYELTTSLAEDRVWREDVSKVLGVLPKNVMDIWHHGFTEMFNNAIDHSSGNNIMIYIRKNAVNTELLIHDDGIGIFKKIQNALNLIDERHALLELSKGKLTTDPRRHSGEGIFFTSRMFDSFNILAGGVYFHHESDKSEDWILENSDFRNGTSVRMKLHNHTARSCKKIFDQFSSNDGNYRFDKTVVPVKLAQYGDDNLVSRSQAKRLLARIELFKIVILDFSEVDSIGQAFADEIFRVFAFEHRNIQLIVENASDDVMRMINRARSATPPAQS